MKLSNRSYPHPVVGNIVNGSPDVPGAQFQVAVNPVPDAQNVYLEVSPSCSSSILEKLIADSKAKLVVHVECSNTVYRKAFVFGSLENLRFGIQVDQLNGNVDVNVFVVAMVDISNYIVDGANSDYDGVVFDLRKGDVLAIAAPSSFEIIPGIDTLKNIGSIMQIHASKSEGDRPMQVQYGKEKIVVILSKPDFKKFRLLQSLEVAKGPLATIVTLPALMHALQHLQDNPADFEDDDASLWIRVLRRKLEELNLKPEMDKLEIAQKILELPIRRALVDSYTAASNQRNSD